MKEPPSRLKAAALGALLFALMTPCLWSVLAMVFAHRAESRTAQETAGIAGFFLAAAALPAGAVFGAALGAAGAPENARRRWAVGAAVVVVGSLAFWLLAMPSR